MVDSWHPHCLKLGARGWRLAVGYVRRAAIAPPAFPLRGAEHAQELKQWKPRAWLMSVLLHAAPYRQIFHSKQSHPRWQCPMRERNRHAHITPQQDNGAPAPPTPPSFLVPAEPPSPLLSTALVVVYSKPTIQIFISMATGVFIRICVNKSYLVRWYWEKTRQWWCVWVDRHQFPPLVLWRLW